jgi:hypothetical protein
MEWRPDTASGGVAVRTETHYAIVIATQRRRDVTPPGTCHNFQTITLLYMALQVDALRCDTPKLRIADSECPRTEEMWARTKLFRCQKTMGTPQVVMIDL